MTGHLLAAAVCPHPPALLPQIAPGTDDVLGPLRQACDDAVRDLLESGPERVVVLGPGPAADDLDELAGGTLAPYGVDVRAGGSTTQLPLSLTVGAWLLDRAGWTGPRIYSTGCPEVDDRVAVLVMADGTTRRSEKAPGFLDERAEPFDRAIAAALAAGDAEALAALDVDLAADLGATGVPALHALARLTKGAAIGASLRLDDAPLGVGYVVASWVVHA